MAVWHHLRLCFHIEDFIRRVVGLSAFLMSIVAGAGCGPIANVLAGGCPSLGEDREPASACVTSPLMLEGEDRVQTLALSGTITAIGTDVVRDTCLTTGLVIGDSVLDADDEVQTFSIATDDTVTVVSFKLRDPFPFRDGDAIDLTWEFAQGGYSPTAVGCSSPATTIASSTSKRPARSRSSPHRQASGSRAASRAVGPTMAAAAGPATT